MQPDSPYQKPAVTLAHLGEMDVGQDMLDALLDDHQDWARTYLAGDMSLPGGVGMVGVGIAEHRIDGQPTGRPALHVLIDRSKKTRGSLPTLTANGLPIVYEVVGEIRPAASPRQRFRPAFGGVSIAPVARNYSGTLGCVVQANGVRYILSCNHVLADCNTLPRGAAISQPSVYDGGQPSDVIANLSYFVPLVFGGLSPANAAIAAVAPGVTVDPRILRGSGAMEALVAPVLQPMTGLTVRKSGRTTGDTQGSVRSIGLTVKINFAQAGVATVSNLFSVEGTSAAPVFAAPGDSGALVATASANQPVGMVVATGTSGTPATYASSMVAILNALTTQVGAPVMVVYA